MSLTTTIIYNNAVSQIAGSSQGANLWLNALDLRQATGWEIRPEGICREEVCVAIFDRGDLLRNHDGDAELDLGAFASLIDQPWARDATNDVWYFGPTLEQRGAMTNLRAPDFSLPDLDGHTFSLAGLRGKKVLLALWASW